MRLRHGRNVTCSKECQYKSVALKNSKSSEYTCSVCGTKFSRPPSQVKSKHEGIYCSRECHYQGRSIGLTSRVVTRPYNLVAEYDHTAASLKAWVTRRLLGKDRHSEATKERLREATIRYISRHHTNAHVSRLEDKVAEELTRMGLTFIRQFKIRDPKTGRYVAIADFYFASVKSILEVNGTYWHADPRTYPNGPVTESQTKCVTNYARKVTALKSLGIPLAEVWEADLRKSFVDALRCSLNTIGL